MGAVHKLAHWAGRALGRISLRLMRAGEAGGRAAIPEGSLVRLSPEVSMTPAAAEMVGRGMAPRDRAPEPEEHPLRGSLEARFPTTR